MKKNNPAKKITIAALSIALVCLSTMVIQIPIPLGYMHLGNTLILLTAYLFGPTVGLLAGGIGSALADLLTGFVYWALPTLIIKGIMGLAIAAIAGKFPKKKMLSVRTFLSAIAGVAIMVVGYFIGGSILYGGIAPGAAQIPGLTIEGLIGMGLFFLIGIGLEKAGFSKRIRF